MLIQLLAALALAAVLWMLFRFAMGPRWAKVSREHARSRAESQGRRVLAEIPLAGDELVFFEEDGGAFHWAGRRPAKADIAAARLLLNGNVVGAVARPGATPAAAARGRGLRRAQRWDVLLYLRQGGAETVPCGTLREGVSREIAARVFEAVRRAVER